MSRMVVVPLLLLLASRTASAEPRYLAAIREELTKVGVHATCNTDSDTRARCRYVYQPPGGTPRFDMRVDYSDDSDTIYHYANRYLVVPASSPRLAEVLRRMMILNWSMLVGKFQWDPQSGEVRLSAVENTDSNFDRRAFRSTVQAFHNLAVRYWRELDAIARGTPPPAAATKAPAPAKVPAPAKKAPISPASASPAPRPGPARGGAPLRK